MTALLPVLGTNSLVHDIGEIFQPLLKLVASILAFFFAIIPNYPIDVALLTIVIMALLTPLTVKSTKNMAAMQALSPELKKLQQKYKGPENRAQLNEEMMKLYKEHNVNPASGCLPMLLQFPAFIILYNVIRGITNTVTVTHTAVVNGHKVTTSVVKAEPRYLSHSSKMYQDIVAAHGQLNSFGMDFAQKLLTHHSSVWVAIPYLLLVLGAVALQYLQMARLNARNPQAAQANPQAAMLQKYLPLIFGLIYLNVAAILNVYFIVSSAIRILTQEILFRRGIVAGPPVPGAKPARAPALQRETTLPKAAGGGDRKGSPDRAVANGANGKGTAEAAKRPAPKAGGAGANRPAGNGASSGNGRQPSTTGRPRAGGNRPGGTGNRGSAATGAEGAGATQSAAKPHPRSKAKRTRKAR